MVNRREMMLSPIIGFVCSFFGLKSISKEDICKNIHQNIKPDSIVWTYRFNEKFSTTKVYKSGGCKYVLIEWKGIQIGDVLLLVKGNFARRTLATQTPDFSDESNPVGMVAEKDFNKISTNYRKILGI